jgi:hypothetical protein
MLTNFLFDVQIWGSVKFMILLLWSWRGGRFLFNKSRDVLQAEAWDDYSGGRSITGIQGGSPTGTTSWSLRSPHRLRRARPPPQSPGVAPLAASPVSLTLITKEQCQYILMTYHRLNKLQEFRSPHRPLILLRQLCSVAECFDFGVFGRWSVPLPLQLPPLPWMQLSLLYKEHPLV